MEYDTTRIYYLKMLINKDKETVIWQRWTRIRGTK
ncbi:hypothetical protein COPEUT_02774 [Coprococcus eutactus ATCC 27759]|nr:hypothetical protein COPEUT_02774 [Coprococcus eutactus ATCC 27759]